MGLDYKHEPLTQQLDSGVRQIELDIFADSQGGRYAHPAGPRMVAEAQLPPDPPFDPEGLMMKPGFKVMHVQDIDYRSVCQPFIACLKEVRRGRMRIRAIFRSSSWWKRSRIQSTAPCT